VVGPQTEARLNDLLGNATHLTPPHVPPAQKKAIAKQGPAGVFTSPHGPVQGPGCPVMVPGGPVGKVFVGSPSTPGLVPGSPVFGGGKGPDVTKT
jgi:hypothetical protein